jgi:hypothetical protein
MGGLQQAIMMSLVQNVVEKNQYNTDNLRDLHRGSVVFRDELADIVVQSTTQFEEMRRQTISMDKAPSLPLK